MKRKRTAGQGNVRKLKSGSWRGELMDGYTDDGKRNMISFSAPTRGEVLDLIRDYQNQAEANIYLDKELTLETWGKTWYADHQSQVQPSTYCSYKYTLQLIIKHLGCKLVKDVKLLDINQFLDALASQGYSLSQMRKCRTMLIQIFDAADHNGLIVRNPARHAKTIRNQDLLADATSNKDAFSQEEVAYIRQHLSPSLMKSSILTMLGTGLRVQELLALTAKDIAPDGSTITVSKAVKMVDGLPVLGAPKSTLSNRIVPVPAAYRADVSALKTLGSKPYLWSQSAEKPLLGVGSFRRKYYLALNSLEDVRRLTPHCCRHTYITRLQEKGIPMETIARLAGHSSIDTTVGYLHLSPETMAQAVSVLNDQSA